MQTNTGLGIRQQEVNPQLRQDRAYGAIQDSKGVRLPFEITDWLDALPAYNLTNETLGKLELWRELIVSGAYYWQGVVFPGTDIAVAGSSAPSIAGQATAEGNIKVEPGSFVTSISAFTNQNAGIKYQIYDVGSKQYLFNRVFGKDTLFDGQTPPDGGIPNVPIGPYILATPLVILAPGMIQVEITNLATVTAICQVFITLATPISRASLQANEIRKAG